VVNKPQALEARKDEPLPTNRIAPSEEMRQCLEQLLAAGIEQDEAPTSPLLRLAARVVLQETLEAEQRDVVGGE